MEGLQLIQDRILEQARDKAAEIAERANEQCSELLAQANSERERFLADSAVKTEAQTEAMLNRARSLAAMEKRKNNLQKRQRLIDKVIDQALLQVCRQSKAEKLDLYTKLVRISGAEDGIIKLSASDQNLAGDLLKQLGSGYEISAEEGSFSGGLILQRGRIEDNLTFDLIVRNQRPQLSAVAAGALPREVIAADKE